MDRFLDPKNSRFNYLPIGVIVRLVQNGQRLFGRVDRRSHILADPLRPYQPTVVQKFDITGGIDSPHEVKAPGCHRQPLGLKARNKATQVGRQFWHTDIKPHLCWRFPLQTRRSVFVMIPARKAREFALNALQISKCLARPKPLAPETVKRLDLMVALRFVDRGKDRFHSAKQTQPRHATNDQPMCMAITKRPFVVELMQTRKSELFPGLEKMATSSRSGLVEVLRQASSMREQVERVEVLNLRTTTDVLGDDVGGLHRIDFPYGQPWVVSRFGRNSQRMCQSGSREDALNCFLAWQWFDFQLEQLAPDGARPNQAVVGRFEGSPQFDHQMLQFRSHNRRNRQRSTRVIGKVGMRIVSEFQPPFVEPSSRPLQIGANIFSSLSVQATTVRFTRLRSCSHSLTGDLPPLKRKITQK